MTEKIRQMRAELEALRAEARAAEDAAVDEAERSFRQFAYAELAADRWAQTAHFASLKDATIKAATDALADLAPLLAEAEARDCPSVVGGRAARLGWQLVLEIASASATKSFVACTERHLHPARAALTAIAEGLYELANRDRSLLQPPVLLTDWALSVVRGDYTNTPPVLVLDPSEGAPHYQPDLASYGGILIWLAQKVSNALALSWREGESVDAALARADERLAARLPELVRSVVRLTANAVEAVEVAGPFDGKIEEVAG